MDSMNTLYSGTHLRLPGADYSCDESELTGLGRHNPVTRTVMAPLFDLGLEHCFIAKRKDYRSQGVYRRDYHAFVLQLDGERKDQVCGREYAVTAGSLAYYPLETERRYSCPGNSWFLYLTFEDHPCWRPLVSRGAYVREYESADLLYLLVKRIESAVEDPTTLALSFAARDAEMVADLLKREVELATRDTGKHAHPLRQLVKRIRERPGAGWSLASMAAQVYVSKRTLLRLFSAEYGISPIDMVVRERMSRARAMLEETDTTVGAVARAVGYQSVASFTVLFKKQFGIPPGRCKTIRREGGRVL